jgi:uncharacterized membrane protein
MHKTFERVSWLLVIALIVYTIAAVSALPDRIPIHFNFEGEADNYGSKQMLWMFPVIAATLVGLMSVVKRHPEHLNIPVKITEENRERQQHLAMGLLSSIGCAVPILFGFIIYSTQRYVSDGSFDMPIVLLLSIVLVPIVIYFFLAYKAR